MPHRISAAEYTRLATLYGYGALDTAPDPAIDRIVGDLATVLRVPVAQFVLADLQRFWAKSSLGPVSGESLRGGTLADFVVAEQPTLLVADTEAPDRTPGDLPLSDVPLRSYAAFRITSPEDDALGVLQVADTHPRVFSASEAAAIEAAAHQISVLIESQRRARHDPETGALHRAAFAENIARMVAAARRGRQRVSLVRLDLTAFRASLEAMGVGLGRIALHRMADIGLRQVRRRDCFGRLADDVFAVLLTDTGEAGAQVLAERLRLHLAQGWSGSVPHSEPVAFTIVTAKPTVGDGSEAMLLAAVAGQDEPEMQVPRRVDRSA